MQRLDAAKRRTILDAAASLFAQRPYHEVRLEDVAQRAGVGKGTLYLYFESKEDLYSGVILESFSRLIERLGACEAACSGNTGSWELLTTIVHELVHWASSSPDLFKLMRSEREPTVPALFEKRQELGGLIQRIIERGVARGELCDPRPDITAQFIPACVRGALRHGPAGASAEEISDHILRIIGHGIRTGVREAA